jgi:hypothetical protein
MSVTQTQAANRKRPEWDPPPTPWHVRSDERSGEGEHAYPPHGWAGEGTCHQPEEGTNVDVAEAEPATRTDVQEPQKVAQDGASCE